MFQFKFKDECNHSHTSFTPVLKALPNEPEWRTIHGVADGIRPQMRRAFLRAIGATSGAMVLADVERAIEAGNLRAAEEAIPWETLTLELGATAEIMRTAFERAGNASMKYLPKEVQTNLRFDILNPRAVEWIRENTGELITGVTESSRQAIRDTIERAFNEGMHPRKSARHIRSLIGLTERQALAVDNRMRRMIEDRIPEARAMEEANRYARDLLRDRAENIARTETINASNNGSLELHRQAVDEGLIREDTTKRFITTPDDRLCSVCAPLDGQRQPLNRPFQTSIGPVMVPTVHPRCRCSYELVFD